VSLLGTVIKQQQGDMVYVRIDFDLKLSACETKFGASTKFLD
jgi:hypothetical protein